MDDLTKLEVDGAKLKEAREKTGLTLSEAARRVGVSRQYLWNIENEKQKPGADIFIRLCALCDVDANEVSINLESAA
jgi:transcriptional regulator with XRE-family HTH domain